jgi:sporulation protein YlmC with PRC-barrel domain
MTRQQNSSRKSETAAPFYPPVPWWPDIASRNERQAMGIFLALFAALGLLFFAVSTRPALSQDVQLVKIDVSVVGKGQRASKLIGSTVSNDKNEKIGKLDDIIVDNNRVMYAVLQVGGFLGLGSRLVAVPYDSLKVDEAGKSVVLPGASKDELKKLAEFKYLA